MALRCILTKTNQILNLSSNSINNLHNFQRFISVSSLKMIKQGDELPDGKLYENSPGNTVQISSIVKGKKVVIFGVPGAFTPGCSKTHLPGYVSNRGKLTDKGVDEVICLSVNDAFVMAAWGKEHDANGKVRMLADPDAAYVKALGLDINLPPLGGTRSKRFAMVVEDGKITQLNVEPDGTGLSCSLVEQIKL